MPIFAQAAPQSTEQWQPYARLAGSPMFAAPLLNGDAGVSQTVAKMRELIDQALRDPQIKRLANDIVRSVPPHDDHAEANAIYNWVLGNIRFTKDPINKETLFPPSELLHSRAGDCDDFTMLIATLLMAIGINARAITVSAPGEDPSQFSHIYPEAQIDGVWTPLDAARPDASFGAAPPMYYRMRAWSLSDDSFQDLSGLSGTNVHAHPGSTVHVSLGAYPRFRSLGSYGNVTPPVRRLGTTTSQRPGTVGASAGQIASTIAADAANLWKSFETQFTPSAPRAGYPVQPANSSSDVTPILLLLGAGFLAWRLL